MVSIRNNSKAQITVEIPTDDGPKKYFWAASVDAQGGESPHIVRVSSEEWEVLGAHPAIKHFRDLGTFEVFEGVR